LASAFTWSIERDLAPYIETHLAYELKFLLVGATTWSAVHDEAARAQWPHHLVVMAMEASFVHTRTLSEFLGQQEGWEDRSPHIAPALPLWRVYCEPMHMKVLHPDPRRPYEIGARRGDDLKEQVVALAQEVLDGWDAVSAQTSMERFRDPMIEARGRAVDDAQRAARRLGISIVFTYK
jgi:hypothetical protein